MLEELINILDLDNDTMNTINDNLKNKFEYKAKTKSVFTEKESKKLDSTTNNKKQEVQLNKDYSDLDENEIKIIQSLDTNNKKHIDEIIEITNIKGNIVMQLLIKLELSDHINQVSSRQILFSLTF